MAVQSGKRQRRGERRKKGGGRGPSLMGIVPTQYRGIRDPNRITGKRGVRVKRYKGTTTTTEARKMAGLIVVESQAEQQAKLQAARAGTRRF